MQQSSNDQTQSTQQKNIKLTLKQQGKPDMDIIQAIKHQLLVL
jgi:hypothetical protein